MVSRDFHHVFSSRHVDERGAGEGAAAAVDVLVHPATISTAPLAAERERAQAYAQDVLTVPASLAGLPAICLPAGNVVDDGGGPIGVQVTTRWGGDELLWRVGRSVGL
jgi:aspartyl-tRNA(Asn)/glutamyl-tRNA(Gln) amidotransferase subunit A